MRKYLAELIGTMVLVLFGCGSAILGGGMVGEVGQGITTLGVGMCFGLAVLVMVYCIGHISGCHINPAITLGVLLSGKMSGKDALWYMIFQYIGALIGSLILFILVSTGSHEGPTATGANSYKDGMMVQAFVMEAVFTFVLVLVVLGVTDKKYGWGIMAGVAIGWMVGLANIVGIPITGTSVNPARSFGPAIFEGGQALSQLWLFFVAPYLGGAVAAGVWKVLSAEDVPSEAK